MEHLKIVIKTNYELLILTGGILFVIGVFFFSDKEYGMGLFGNTGTTFLPLAEDAAIFNEGTGHLQGYVNDYIPCVHYNGGALRQGDSVRFKDLLSVELENGTMVRGDMESGFALYLIDIQKQSGNSVLEIISTEELEEMEEIPNIFVYDREFDMLYIFGSGTFTVRLKIYSDAGRVETYEFLLPVEV